MAQQHRHLQRLHTRRTDLHTHRLAPIPDGITSGSSSRDLQWLGCAALLLLIACKQEPSIGESSTTEAGSTASDASSGASADETATGGSGAGDPQQVCTRYIDCVAAVSPAGVADAIHGYGPEGTCWTPETTEVCVQACISARRELWELFPEQSACADCEADTDCLMDSPTSVCDVEQGVCVDCAEVDECAPGPCGPPAPSCNACASSLDCDGSACFEGECGYAPLLPVGEGNQWRYSVEFLGAGPDNCFVGVTGTDYIDGPSMTLPNGVNALRYVGFCGFEYYIASTGDFVDVYGLDGELAVLALQEPVEEGFAWESAPGRTFSWTRELGPVTVPAGTFDDCWTREDLSFAYLSTYCRGVGKIREVLGDVDGYVAELTAYELH